MMIERLCLVLKGTAGVPHAVFWSAWGLAGLAVLGGWMFVAEVLV